MRNVIAVVSGKGGVGKSMVTASLARMMREQGFSVGILDADITGPSIPKMYGIHDTAKGSDDGIFPEIAKDGTKIMSVNLLLPNESDPVIWRAPIITSVVTQFWTDVIWGDLDYLFVDMPPGTGDVPLTVFQSLPVNGAVIVTSPQDLVRMIVEKAYKMVRQMNIPVLGIVENYSYLTCPDCGKKISVFGESHIDEVAAELGIPVLGKMPIDPALSEMVENEKFYEVSNEYLADAVNKI
ncbi:MAG: P-loop NTPase [Dorea formicigenerans]